MNKYIIEANKHVGKTTLVNKVLEISSKDVIGLKTVKIDELKDQDGMYPIYLFPIKSKPVINDSYYVGRCGRGKHFSNDEVFNTIGVELLTSNNSNQLIIIDELGFLEMKADKYIDKIIEILNSNNPVLIMMKTKTSPEFLDRLKTIKNVEHIFMDLNNRNDIQEKIVKEFI